MPGRLAFGPVTTVPLVDGMDLATKMKICDFPREGFREKRSHYATRYSQ